MSRAPLDFPRDRWRWRWMVLPTWNRLHRLSELDEYDPEWIVGGKGVAVCGASGEFRMPGIFSRMGLPRCAHCCRIVGIPNGDGCPENSGVVS